VTVARAGRLPVWERLRAPDRRPLRVSAVRRLTLDDAVVDDGDLLDPVGATLFDAWRDADGGYRLRAARIVDDEALPYAIAARSLRVQRSDGRLEALLAGAGSVAADGQLERQACACRGISTDAAYRAIGAGWATAEEVKRATRIGFGDCQGRRCLPWLAERLELAPDDPRAQVTARPPLVPVPASVLAAYAADNDQPR
jgi:bacterioferritin-associated ferredoxin